MVCMIQASHRFHSSSDMAVAQQFGDKAHGTKAFVKLSLVSFMYLLTAPSIFHFGYRSQKALVLGEILFFILKFTIYLNAIILIYSWTTTEP